MNPFNEKSINNSNSYKNIFKLKKIINKEKRSSLELTKGSIDSSILKEKSNNNDFSFKKIKKIKDIMPNTNKSINYKETLSYQNSYFPICLSFMTNTKNYINSINNKFKMGNPLYISENKTIEEFKTIYNNSMINSYNTHKNNKINLNLNFKNSKDNKNKIPKINIVLDKKDYSRNLKKFDYFESSKNHSFNIKNIYHFLDSKDKSVNIYNPKKIIKKKFKNSFDIKREKESEEDQIKQRILEINKFLSMNLSKKKLQDMFHEKLNLSVAPIEPTLEQKENQRNPSLKSIKRISKNPGIKNTPNSKIGMPKIVNYNNPNTSTVISTSTIKKNDYNNKKNNNKNSVIEKKETFKDSDMKKTNNIEDNKNEKKLTLNLVSRKEEKKKTKKKNIKIKRNSVVKKSLISIIKKKKPKEKKIKFKFTNIIQKNDKLKNINDKNLAFIKEINEDNDNTNINKKMDKQIKANKVSKLLNHKINIDKIITKQKEKLKNYIFSFNEKFNLKDIIYNQILKNNKNINRKIYLNLKKISVLYIVFNSYITYINKCALDNNMLNYIRLHVEFSSIYLPEVKLGEEKSIFITDKLFSFKSKQNNNIIHMIKTKFIESKKYQKSALTIALNFIIKELFYYNISSSENINYLDNNNSENNETDSSKNKKILPNKRNKKSAELFKKNSIIKKGASSNISLLEKKKFYDISKKGFENKLKYSLNSNLLLYKLSKNSDDIISKNNTKLNIKERVSKQYIRKAMTLIHENKIKKDISNHSIDYFEILRKITKKEDIEIILRTFILEGETTLFTEYFKNNYRRININSKDEDGNTFLILSTKQGLNFITKTLLEKGIDVNIQNNLGNSALHYALSAKDYDIADLLKKFGAKEDCYNKFGYTPWDCVGKVVEGVD